VPDTCASLHTEREKERILFTKANIQYQYHETITSARLPEGITGPIKLVACSNDNRKTKSIGREERDIQIFACSLSTEADEMPRSVRPSVFPVPPAHKSAFWGND